MIVGEGGIGFLLFSTSHYLYYRDPKQAIYIGFLGSVCIHLPDVDILFGMSLFFFEILGENLSFTSETFWTQTNSIHRGITHSIIIVPFGIVVSSIPYITTQKKQAYALIGVIILLSAIFTDIYTASVLILFSLITLILIYYAKDKFSYMTIITVLSLSLFLHPFTDIFTGTPPQIFYPFFDLQMNRAKFHSNEVIHNAILAGIEIGALVLSTLSFYFFNEKITDNNVQTPLQKVRDEYL